MKMNETELGRTISQLAAEVHQSVGGAGLPAVAYRDALTYALTQRGLPVEARTIPAGTYPGVKLSRSTRVEMIVDDKVIVECKTETGPADEAEALAHLRVTGLRLALIINFGADNIRSAVRRVTDFEQ
jgi:GxxExxY protein